MGDDFEAGWYKSVVDDLSVAKERITEERNELREQVKALQELMTDLTLSNRTLAMENERLRIALSQGVEL